MRLRLLCAVLLANLMTVLAHAGTVTGSIQRPNGQPLANGVLTFSLSQAGVTQSGAITVTSDNVYCGTSATGTVVGITDPAASAVLSANYGAGTLPATQYFVKFTYTAASGESAPSPETTFLMTGSGTLNGNAPSLQPGNATGYKVYIGTTSGGETLQQTIVGFAGWSQSAALVAGASPPVSNSTQCNTLIFNDAITPSYTTYLVNLIDSKGKQVAGYPQRFYFAGASVDLSTLAPAGNLYARFPTAIVAQPGGNGLQSIAGPLSLGPYSLTVGNNILSTTTLSDYTVAGFSKLNSGFFATSSLVTKGALDLYNNATGVIFRNGVFNAALGKTGTLQAGDTASGTATWLANSVYNLPDLAQGEGVDASGFLYGASGSKLNASVGNCVYGSGINTSNNAGILENSGFGCNTNIVFPTFGQAVEWSASSRLGVLNPTTLTGNRTWTLPDTSGTVALGTATGTATVDLASVASAACTGDSSDVTLTGASVGDPVRVTAATALPAGVWLIGRVTASNTGRFQLCNLSGGAVDRASDTYTISVVK